MDLRDAIEVLADRIARDYGEFCSKQSHTRVGHDYAAEMREGINTHVGRKYLKITHKRGNDPSGQEIVWGFIVIDPNHKKFKYGDLLKAASYSQPATNMARGNVFENYAISWTGPLYKSSLDKIGFEAQDSVEKLKSI